MDTSTKNCLFPTFRSGIAQTGIFLVLKLVDHAYGLCWDEFLNHATQEGTLLNTVIATLILSAATAAFGNTATVENILKMNRLGQTGYLAAPMGATTCKVEVSLPPTAFGNYYGIQVRSPAEGGLYFFNAQFHYPAVDSWVLDLSNSKVVYHFSESRYVEFTFDPTTLKFTKFSDVYSDSYQNLCLLN